METLRNNHQVLASIEISRYTYFRTHRGGNFAVGIVFEFALYVQNIVLTFSDRRETAYWQALKARFEPPGMQVLRVANGRTRQKLIAFEDPRFFFTAGGGRYGWEHREFAGRVASGVYPFLVYSYSRGTGSLPVVTVSIVVLCRWLCLLLITGPRSQAAPSPRKADRQRTRIETRPQ